MKVFSEFTILVNLCRSASVRQINFMTKIYLNFYKIISPHTKYNLMSFYPCDQSLCPIVYVFLSFNIRAIYPKPILNSNKSAIGAYFSFGIFIWKEETPCPACLFGSALNGRKKQLWAAPAITEISLSRAFHVLVHFFAGFSYFASFIA